MSVPQFKENSIYKKVEGPSFAWNSDNPLENGQLKLNRSKLERMSNGKWRQFGDSKTRIMIMSPHSQFGEEDPPRESHVIAHAKNGLKSIKERGFWENPETDFPKALELRFRGFMLKNDRPPDNAGSQTFEFNSLVHDPDIAKGRGGTGNHFTIEADTSEIGFEKEQVHPVYDKDLPKKDAGINIKEEFGVSVVLYNVPSDNGDEEWVKLEYWVDKENNGKFKKEHEHLDKNDWGKEMKQADSSFKKGESATWTSPAIVFKNNEKEFAIETLEVYPLKIPVEIDNPNTRNDNG